MEIRPHTSTTPPAPANADKAPGPPILPTFGAATAAVPTQTAVAAQQPAPVPRDDDIARALASINHLLRDRSQDLEFSVDPDSARTIVKVVDKSTHEVIRQMPTQEALDIAKTLDHLHSLLIKQQA